MYNKYVKTLFEDENKELIFNTKNHSTLLLEKNFSEYVRISEGFEDLKKLCEISESELQNFKNTYQYFIKNGFLMTKEYEMFNDKFFQWQSREVNIICDVADLEVLPQHIERENLIVNELIIVAKEFKENHIKELDTLKTFVSKISLILVVDTKNCMLLNTIIKKTYNKFDEFVIAFLENVDKSSFSLLIDEDYNGKIFYQIFIEDLIEYRDIFNYLANKKINTFYSSKVFCCVNNFQNPKFLNVHKVLNVIKNNKHCLSVFNGEKITNYDVFPHTINTLKKEFVFNKNEFFDNTDLYQCPRKCKYSLFCPYACILEPCEYELLLDQELSFK